MKTFRLNEMEQYIQENGTVTMQTLCDHFQVSLGTIRQDVGALVQKGTVTKVYGGVSSARPGGLVPFDERRGRNFRRKQAIGKKAAELLQDRDVLFLDSGTTTMQLIEHIPPEKRITVLTHNLSAMQAAIPYEHVELISLPGKLDRRTNSFLAADLRYFEQYNITIAMMATTGISPVGDVTNSILLEHEIKRMAVEKSERTYLMADSGKFERASLITYAKLDQFTGIVTDSDISPAAAKLVREAGIDLQLAKLKAD